MPNELFFHDSGLPFAEGRYSRDSQRNFKPHMHRSFSIGCVDRGRVRYRVADRTAYLLPGMLALINPETLHSCNTLQDEERSYYMLHLDVDWCLQVQKSLWQVESFMQVQDMRLCDVPLYHRYCRTMQHLMNPHIHRSEKEQLLFELAAAVFSKTCRAKADSEIDSGGDLSWLKKKLAENLGDDLTLTSLAQEAGANPYTLLRRFKTLTGITPHAYRMNCRIEQARRYLQQGQDIADTALECGFFDQSHLHRHFKAATTVTPREYRVNFIQYSS